MVDVKLIQIKAYQIGGSMRYSIETESGMFWTEQIGEVLCAVNQTLEESKLNDSSDGESVIDDDIHGVTYNPKTTISLIPIEEIKIDSLEQIIQKIKKIIGDQESFHIEFYSNQICFCIYTEEVILDYTAKDNLLCFRLEGENSMLDAQSFDEVGQIMQILQANKPLLRKFCVKEE